MGIVLGAFGCGAFANDSRLVADVMNQVFRQEFPGVFERVVMCIINGRGNTAQDQAKWDAFEQRFINAKAVKPTGGFWDKIWGGKPAAVETGMCKHGCGHPVA